MLSVFSAIKIFSEIRDGTKERMQEKREIDMTDEDREDFKNAIYSLLHVEMTSKSPNRLQKEVAKYKKVRDKGHKPLKLPFS